MDPYLIKGHWECKTEISGSGSSSSAGVCLSKTSLHPKSSHKWRCNSQPFWLSSDISIAACSNSRLGSIGRQGSGDGEPGDRELGGVYKVEGEGAEEEDQERQQAVREDGQELEREGGDPQPQGPQAHRQDPQGRRSPRQAQHLLKHSLSPPLYVISFPCFFVHLVSQQIIRRLRSKWRS